MDPKTEDSTSVSSYSGSDSDVSSTPSWTSSQSDTESSLSPPVRQRRIKHSLAKPQRDLVSPSVQSASAAAALVGTAGALSQIDTSNISQRLSSIKSALWKRKWIIAFAAAAITVTVGGGIYAFYKLGLPRLLSSKPSVPPTPTPTQQSRIPSLYPGQTRFNAPTPQPTNSVPPPVLPPVVPAQPLPVAPPTQIQPVITPSVVPQPEPTPNTTPPTTLLPAPQKEDQPVPETTVPTPTPITTAQ